MTYPIDTSHHSPNHDPRNARISMLVIHATVGSYASSLAWLCSPQSRVSTHYLLRKDGHIAQLVPDALAAWHAGKSMWHGETDINERSIGIELENRNDGRDPYPPAQLRAAHWLCQSLIARYNIERGDVVRHLDVAMPRGRKTDPAGLPWPAFADSLYIDVPDPPYQERRYVVKDEATAGATIRAAPRTNAAILGRLHSGDRWTGELIPGQLVTIPGFGSSNQWVRDSHMKCVWSGLLEKVKE